MKKLLASRLQDVFGHAKRADIAALFDVSVNAVGKWIRGEAAPAIETFSSICRHYKVSADWLLGLSDTLSPLAATEPATPYACAPPAAHPPETCPDCARLRSELDRALGKIDCLERQAREMLDRIARPTKASRVHPA